MSWPIPSLSLSLTHTHTLLSLSSSSAKAPRAPSGSLLHGLLWLTPIQSLSHIYTAIMHCSRLSLSHLSHTHTCTHLSSPSLTHTPVPSSLSHTHIRSLYPFPPSHLSHTFVLLLSLFLSLIHTCPLSPPSLTHISLSFLSLTHTHLSSPLSPPSTQHTHTHTHTHTSLLWPTPHHGLVLYSSKCVLGSHGHPLHSFYFPCLFTLCRGVRELSTHTHTHISVCVDVRVRGTKYLK